MYPGLHNQGHLFHLPIKAGTELEVKTIVPTYMQFGINNPNKKCLIFDLTYLRSKYPGQGFSRRLWVANVNDFEIIDK